ncbi:MAG: MBL fold metallo-hydrolase [Patescibacteria group bacterium]|mgnify:CR=1 FL=1
MRVHILGSGAYPLRFSGGRSLSIFFPEHHVVLDAGLGLLALPVDAPQQELAIILSHFHHDHILGLASIDNLLQSGQYKFIRILGDERIKHLATFFREPFNPDYEGAPALPILMEQLATDVDIRGLHIRRRQVPHASGFSNLFTFQAGAARLGISTDTTASVANADFFTGCDVLLHECNYDNAHAQRATVEGHSYPSIIAALANAAGVRRLGLIHTDPRYPLIAAEAQAAFPGAWVMQDDEILEVQH